MYGGIIDLDRDADVIGTCNAYALLLLIMLTSHASPQLFGTLYKKDYGFA